jgi:hypothetical protein
VTWAATTTWTAIRTAARHRPRRDLLTPARAPRPATGSAGSP